MEQVSECNQEQEVEFKYVRNTYNQIANYFSDTRYSKWPKIHKFISDLPLGTILLDIGCGNGKYLDSNTNLMNIGCDSCMGLLKICVKRKYNVVACDVMDLPFRCSSIDVIICIAVIHHLSSAARRKKCLIDMIKLLKDGGVALIYVWSFEQDIGKPNGYLKKSIRDSSAHTPSIAESEEETSCENRQTLFSNLPVHKNRTPFIQQDLLVPFSLSKTKKCHSQGSPSDGDISKADTYLRYYHVFKQGELDSMISEIANVQTVDSYYDHGNWCVQIRKVNSVLYYMI